MQAITADASVFEVDYNHYEFELSVCLPGLIFSVRCHRHLENLRFADFLREWIYIHTLKNMYNFYLLMLLIFGNN